MPSRRPIGERLRELREGLKPKPSQREIGEHFGGDQVWMSRRETGEVNISVVDAIRVAELLGYSAELVILPAKQAELLAAFSGADPEGAALALRLIAALPHLSTDAKKLVVGLIELAELQVRERAAG